MPFVSRVPQLPPLQQILEIEQIVVVDATGPAINLGVAPGPTSMVGEFLKGGFSPTEVFSTGDLMSTYVGDPNRMDRISQGGGTDITTVVQDGSAVTFDGNGYAELKGKKFKRLIIQRVDADVTTTDAGAVKASLRFNVTIAASDQDPADATLTGKDILIPAGTRFADDTLGLETVIVALSQDLVVPKGTKLTAGAITISSVATVAPNVFNCSQDPLTGLLTVLIDSAGLPSLAVPLSVGPTMFFVKGTTAAVALIDTIIDAAIPNVSSTIAAAGISTVNATGAASAIFAATTDAALVTLANRLTTLYPAAINKLAPTSSPMDEISTIFSARNWAASAANSIKTNIRAALWASATGAAASGRGRIAIVSAPPSASASAANALTAKTFANNMAFGTGNEFAGASNVDADRALICFPYVKVFSSELNKNILVSPGGFKAAMLAGLPTEFQSSVGAPENATLQTIQALEDAFVANPLVRSDYVAFKANGVSALQSDRTAGWWFYSAVTAVSPIAFPTRVADNRRRFADEVQDTLVGIASKSSKKPGTTERVDAMVGDFDAYLSGLLSAENPPQQRIEGYSLDEKSGNTPQLTALGVRTIIIAVRMLGDLNDIVLNTQIGPTVTITQVA